MSTQHRFPDARQAKAIRDLKEALSFEQRGMLQEADEAYSRIVRRNSGYFDALHFYGLFKFKRQQFAEAVRLIEKAHKVNPHSLNALNNLGVVYGHLKRYEQALFAFNKIIERDPKNVQALNNKAQCFNELRRYPETISICNIIETLDATKSDNYIIRGAAKLESALFKGALEDYRKAVELDPRSAMAWCGIGNVYCKVRDFVGARSAYDRALAIKPNLEGAWLGRGHVFYDLGRNSEALECFDKALSLKDDFAEAHYNRAILKLSLGEYEEGWKFHEWRWKKRDFPSPNRGFGQPLWLNDSDIAGKTLLIHAEQGLGDTIQFSRYLRFLTNANCKVFFEVQKPLVALFKAQQWDCEVIAQGDELPSFDVHCPLMSLPLAFKTTIETIPGNTPYIVAPEDGQIEWPELPARRSSCLNIGIAWSGNPIVAGNLFSRPIPLSSLGSIMSERYEWFRLQRDLRETDSEALARLSFIRDFSHLGLADTARLVARLDLVITIDTSFAHLAGAMGKPVWILLPFVPDFRWLRERTDSPWYPMARLYRQTKDDDWTGVLERVSKDLNSLSQR